MLLAGRKYNNPLRLHCKPGKGEGPQLVPDAEFVSKTFKKAFKLFEVCVHSIYDSSKTLSDMEINDLRKLIIIMHIS